MAVLIEVTSVVIRLETIADKYPGGVEQYIKDRPNMTLCMDEDIARLGFMAERDADDFIESLRRDGFKYVKDDKDNEIAIVDQFRGIYLPCDWLEFLNLRIIGYQEVSACKLKGSPINGLAVPPGWKYHESKSNLIITDEGTAAVRMTFLRHEENCDVYFDKLTGKELYIGRIVKRNINS
jgi:hypothetical protein